MCIKGDLKRSFTLLITVHTVNHSDSFSVIESWLSFWLSATWVTAASLALKVELHAALSHSTFATTNWSKDEGPIIHLQPATVVMCQQDALQWVISWVISFNIQFWYFRPKRFPVGEAVLQKWKLSEGLKWPVTLWGCLRLKKNPHIYMKYISWL